MIWVPEKILRVSDGESGRNEQTRQLSSFPLFSLFFGEIKNGNVRSPDPGEQKEAKATKRIYIASSFLRKHQ
jgi:hypothetical protein